MKMSTNSDRSNLAKITQQIVIKKMSACIFCFLMIPYFRGSTAKQNKKIAVTEDYPDTLEDGTYEQQTEADMFYEDAIGSALSILWEHRFHITMANLQMIRIIGRNATETINFRQKLHSMRNIIDHKSEELRNKLDKKLPLRNMSEPIEGEIFNNLMQTWSGVKGVFDIHQPQNRTHEFSQMYNWISNAENYTSTAYKKVKWLMRNIRRMRSANL